MGDADIFYAKHFLCGSSGPGVLRRKAVLNVFIKFIEKHLRFRPFFIKDAELQHIFKTLPKI